MATLTGRLGAARLGATFGLGAAHAAAVTTGATPVGGGMPGAMRLPGKPSELAIQLAGIASHALLGIPILSQPVDSPDDEFILAMFG